MQFRHEAGIQRMIARTQAAVVKQRALSPQEQAARDRENRKVVFTKLGEVRGLIAAHEALVQAGEASPSDPHYTGWLAKRAELQERFGTLRRREVDHELERRGVRVPRA